MIAMMQRLGALICLLIGAYAAADLRPDYGSFWDDAIHRPGAKITETADMTLVWTDGGLTIWYFTKPNHPAHPGVIKRAFTQADDSGKWVATEHGWSFASDQAQPAFKAWLNQIGDLDRQMKEYTGDTSTPKPR